MNSEEKRDINTECDTAVCDGMMSILSSSDAQKIFELGMAYREGVKVMFDGDMAFKAFERATYLGYPKGQYMLGLCYSEGLGTEKDDTRAIELLSRAAEGGDADAMFKLGEIFDDAATSERPVTDCRRAFLWYARAAKGGHIMGTYRCGLMLLMGKGCDKDASLAVELLTQSSDGGVKEANFYLGSCYEFGEGVECDMIRAVEYYRRAADDLDPRAVNNLGGCYAFGNGVAKDMKKAIELYLLASELGDENASFRLGVCYEEGTGTERDLNKALEYYEKAADKDHPEAVFRMAGVYEKLSEFTSDDPDYGKIAKLYMRSAEGGNIRAAYMAGICCFEGRGVIADKRAAYRWFMSAAERGYAKAEYMVGNAFFYGTGVIRSYQDAIKWYERASGGDEPIGEAFERLGDCALNGKGREKNIDEGLEYLNKAAELGAENAIFTLGDMAFYGVGGEPDYRRALILYTRAAKLGSSAAKEGLANCYYRGLGVRADHQAAYRLYRSAFLGGMTYSGLMCATMMLSGEGCEKNISGGIARLEDLANIDYAPAEVKLGDCYNDKSIRKTNYKRAVDHYTRAVKIDYDHTDTEKYICEDHRETIRLRELQARADARYKLGLILLETRRDADQISAVARFAYAAVAGHVGAIDILTLAFAGNRKFFDFKSSDIVRMVKEGKYSVTDTEKGEMFNYLGELYSKGTVIKQNERCAFSCYSFADELKNIPAKYNLAMCYMEGRGVPKDEKRAVNYLIVAANAGHGDACFELGYCYETGRGFGNRSRRDAIRYYRKAVKAMNSRAKERLHILEKISETVFESGSETK